MTEPNNTPPAPDPAPEPAPNPASAPAPAPPPYTDSHAQAAQQPSPPPPPPPETLGYQTPGSGPPPYAGPAPTADDRTMATIAHVLGIFTSFIGPLIIWLIKKDQSPFIDDQGKEALNFQLTLMIGWVIAFVTTFICIGPFIGMGLTAVAIIFGVLAAIATNKGEAYRYPFNIRIIK